MSPFRITWIPLVLLSSLTTAQVDPAQAPFSPQDIANRAIVVQSAGPFAGTMISADNWSAEIDTQIRFRTSQMEEGVAFVARQAHRSGWRRDLLTTSLSTSGERAERTVATGIVEQLDFRPQGLEVAYRFEERPPGAGDLSVRWELTTDFSAEPGEYGAEGLLLSGPEGEIHIGAVTGIDARGQTVSGRMFWDGEGLELTLPAEFVENATYPLVLDPLLSGVVTLPMQGRYADIAYDPEQEVWIYVWDRQIAYAKHTSVAQALDRYGVPLGVPVFMNGAEFSSVPTKPSLTHAGNLRLFYFAFISDRDKITMGVLSHQPSLSFPAIHSRSELTATVGMQSVEIAADQSDLGGMIVWATLAGTVELDRFVWNSGSLLLTNYRILESSAGGYGGRNVHITESGGHGSDFLVAWESFHPTTTKLQAAVIRRDYDLPVLFDTVLSDPLGRLENPSCAGDGQDFLLLYNLDPHGYAPEQIRSLPINRLGSSFVQGTEQVIQTPATFLPTVTGTDVEWDGTGYVAAWSLQSWGSSVYACGLDPLYGQPCEAPVYLGSTYTRPRVFSPESSAPGSYPGFGAIIWDSTSTTGRAVLFGSCP